MLHFDSDFTAIQYVDSDNCSESEPLCVPMHLLSI